MALVILPVASYIVLVSAHQSSKAIDLEIGEKLILPIAPITS